MKNRLSTTLLAASLLLLAGCAGVGTSAIRSGRAAYNNAMIDTNNEQLLAMIVRMRYQEPSGLLVVESITANVRYRANVNAQVGVGSESSYAGNLVPLSAGALYEENPTISYTPVQGQEYLRQMLTPLPLDVTVLLLSALGDSPRTMTLLVREINGIRSPEFGAGASADADRFAGIAALLASLQRRGNLVWTEDPSDASSFAVLLRGAGDDHTREVMRLHDLLGLAPPQAPEGDIVLRIRPGVGASGKGPLVLTTRTTFDLFRIAAASMDVPKEHLESGLALCMPHRGPASEQMRIRRCASRPANALVAVEHHGWWFYIASTDGRSKETFLVLQALMTARMADSTGGRSSKPVLTVPVSR